MAGGVRPVVPKKGSAPSFSWRSVLLNGRSLNGTANYGQRGGWSLGYHTGQDFGVASGTSVRAPSGGVVTYVGFDKAYGNSVVIKMPDGYYMRFAHLSSTGVSKGDKVGNGGFVGKSGNTGHSTGAHLHIEVMTPKSGGRFGAGNFVNPVSYLNGKKNVKFEGGGSTGSTNTGGSSGSSGNTTTTTTTTGGGGGGGGMTGVAGFTKKDYYRWLDAKFGGLAVLRKMDKEARDELGGESIDWLVDKLAKEKIVDDSIVATYMAKTGWFKKYGKDATEALIEEKQRPGRFAEAVANYRAGLEKSLTEKGVTLSKPAMDQLARDSYVFGWDATRAIDEATSRFTAAGDITYDGGEIGEAEDILEEAAFDLGVQVTEADRRGLREDVLNGSGYQSQLDELRERSANVYTVFADQIRAGKSLRQVAGAYFDKAATLLELGSPDDVDMSDPLFAGGKAFMVADPATGKMVPKGLWEFEKEIKADARWDNTKNAKSSTMERTGQVLSLMGLV